MIVDYYAFTICWLTHLINRTGEYISSFSLYNLKIFAFITIPTIFADTIKVPTLLTISHIGQSRTVTAILNTHTKPPSLLQILYTFASPFYEKKPFVLSRTFRIFLFGIVVTGFFRFLWGLYSCIIKYMGLFTNYRC